MRLLLLSSLLLVTLKAAGLRVDHATVAGLDLKRLQSDFAAAGLPTQYGGKHPERTTEMALISFADGSYLELITKQKDADEKNFAANPWAKLIEHNAGPCAWAIQSHDVAADTSDLRGKGVSLQAAIRSGRTRPDGVHLEWETLQLGPNRGGFFPFLIHDFTPRANRVYSSGKPSAPQYAGVSKIVIAVEDLDSAVAKYRKAFNLAAPELAHEPSLGANTAAFAGTPVVLATPSSKGNWLAARLAKYGSIPCAFVIRKASSTAAPVQWLKIPSIEGRIGIE